jgi:fatty acid desaturase
VPVEQANSSAIPLKRGYVAPRSMRDFIAECHTTNLPRAVTAACADLLVGWLAAVLGGIALVHSPLVVGIPVFVIGGVVTARQLRALECLVHEGSHYNWTRSRRVTNDVLVRLLASAPTGAAIAEYRASHLLHHGKFGTAQDPDWERYQELSIESIDRTRLGPFCAALAGRLVRYQLGWMRTVRANPMQLVEPLAWPLLLIALPLLPVLGWRVAVAAAACWLLGYVVVLPVVRFIGESSEHSFSDSDTVFDATITNTGWWQRLLIHPHNDGYHTVHHMWPGVPFYNLRRLHLELMAEDASCYASRLRYRTRILESPRRGAEFVRQ